MRRSQLCCSFVLTVVIFEGCFFIFLFIRITSSADGVGRRRSRREPQLKKHRNRERNERTNAVSSVSPADDLHRVVFFSLADFGLNDVDVQRESPPILPSFSTMSPAFPAFFMCSAPPTRSLWTLRDATQPGPGATLLDPAAQCLVNVSMGGNYD